MNPVLGRALRASALCATALTMLATMAAPVAAQAPAAAPAAEGGGMPPLRPPSPAVAGARADQKAEPDYKTSFDHYAALKAKANSGAKMTWDKLPDWTGIWESAYLDRFDGVTSAMEHTTAPLNADAEAKYKALRDDLAKGISHDHLTLCVPAGFPRSITLPFFTEFTLTPERALHIAEEQSEVRRIYTDGRDHVPADERYALWSGDAIGFWRGQTLVAHTISLRAFDSGYNRFGPPQSEQMEVVEEITKTSDNEIIDKLTVYDPTFLTKPYHTVLAWRRVTMPGARIDTWSCNENISAAVNADGGTDIILPGEAGSGLGGTPPKK